MKLSFGFGTSTQEVEVPEKNLMGVLHANEVKTGLVGEEEVKRALREPIGSPACGISSSRGRRSPSSPAM